MYTYICILYNNIINIIIIDVSFKFWIQTVCAGTILHENHWCSNEGAAHAQLELFNVIQSIL